MSKAVWSYDSIIISISQSEFQSCTCLCNDFLSKLCSNFINSRMKRILLEGRSGGEAFRHINLFGFKFPCKLLVLELLQYIIKLDTNWLIALCKAIYYDLFIIYLNLGLYCNQPFSTVNHLCHKKSIHTHFVISYKIYFVLLLLYWQQNNGIYNNYMYN